MENSEFRETVIVPEDKKKIKRLKKLAQIKRKYNENMSDEDAEKIRKLEVVNDVLVAATALAGVATVLSYIPGPDDVITLWWDEAIFTGATALLGSASAIVKNKINDLAATGTTDMQMEEATKLSGQIVNVAQKVSEKRQGALKTQ